jgi:hypothetical protein
MQSIVIHVEGLRGETKLAYFIPPDSSTWSLQAIPRNKHDQLSNCLKQL